VQLEERRTHAEGLTVEALQSLLAPTGDAARDLRVNLDNLLGGGELPARSRFGVALACALAQGDVELAGALLRAGGDACDEALHEDAKAAAALMAMNNVVYRFRHQIGKQGSESLPVRLRMQRLAAPRTDKPTFELMSLAVSAINGCEHCVKAHEAVLSSGGMGESQVFEAVRLAGVVAGLATARRFASGAST
jgi:alkyl hydroperoxide reductase subunit D